jgi:uncharacterized FlgJ-related protein
VNKTFLPQIDAIGSAADDIEKVESVISQKKMLFNIVKIFMNKSNEKHENIDRCSICGKKLKFTRITENLLSCWLCMMPNNT